MFASAAHAQSTTVTSTVTDSGGVAWADATYTFTFKGQPGAVWPGGPIPAVISGTLDDSGNLSQLLPTTSTISPGPNVWVLKVCPLTGISTSNCHTRNVNTTVVGGTQPITVTPTAITIQPGTANPLVAYADAEIVAPVPLGTIYYRAATSTTGVYRQCQQSLGQACLAWASLGGSSGGLCPGGAGNEIQINDGTNCTGPSEYLAGAVGNLMLDGGLSEWNFGSFFYNVNANFSNIGNTAAGNFQSALLEHFNNVTVAGSTNALNGVRLQAGETNGIIQWQLRTLNAVQLPLTNGAAGQALTSAGTNPDQLAWTNSIASLTGTANQITVSAGFNPTLSIPTTFLGPGSVGATTELDAGLNGGSAGVLGLNGSTSGKYTCTANATATLMTCSNSATFTNGTVIAGSFQATNTFNLNGKLLAASNSPTIAAAGCGGAAASVANVNGTAAFDVNVGTTPTSGGCTVTMPTASAGWTCDVNDFTTLSSSVFVQKQTASTTTSILLQNFTTAGAAGAPTASDVYHVKCTAH